MSVRSMCAGIGASDARAAGALRGLSSLAGAIFALAAEAAHAQAGADSPLDTGAAPIALQNGDRVIGMAYENTFGRRLAKAVGFLFDPESVLKNLPVPAHPLNAAQGYLCENGGLPLESGVREAIAIVHRAKRPEEADRFIGWTFAPGSPGSVLDLPGLCDWLNGPDLWRAYSELHLFDVMGRKGTWAALEESETPTDVERIMRGSASRAPLEESVARWSVRDKDGVWWTVDWRRVEDGQPSVFAGESGSTWWVYRPEGSFGGPEKETSGEAFYLSYPGPGEDPENSENSAKVLACGVGLGLGRAGCKMTWDAAPARPADPSKEFSLWTRRLDDAAFAAVKSTLSETSKPDWDDWYLLTQQPLPSEKAELLVERAPFR